MAAGRESLPRFVFDEDITAGLATVHEVILPAEN
jgi:hypothetical protein